MLFHCADHHSTPQLLLDSFGKLKKSAAAGVDGVTWRDYEGKGWTSGSAASDAANAFQFFTSRNDLLGDVTWWRCLQALASPKEGCRQRCS